MKLQIIQLEPYDDVASVRDRLAFVSTERVLLVWPRSGDILKRKIDLVLIQREAARRGARLGLVTSEPDVIDHAAELQISTFETVKTSQHARWKRPLNKVFIDRSDRPENAPDAYELMLAASRLRPLTAGQRQMQRAIRLVSVLLLGAVLFSVIYILGPSADVVIYPAQSQINTTVRLVADPSITVMDVESGHIPAALLVIDVNARASIPTTGSSDVPNTLSSGTIVLTNQTDKAVFVPAGTIVSTFGIKPARFRTASDATVAGGIGQTTEVTIEAMQDSAGPAGNVDPNLITTVEGELNQQISARNDNPTRGGTIRQQGIVTQADYDNLLVLAHEKVRQTSLAEFGPRLTGTQFIAPESIKIVEQRPEWNTYSAFIGDPVDTLTLDMRAKVQAVVVDEQLARQAALASLSGKIPFGHQVSPDTVKFTRGAIQGIDPKGQVTFIMSATGSIAVAVNPEQVRQRLAGVGLSDALKLLDRELLLDPRRPPEIRVWPELWRRLPILPLRINILIR